MKYRIKHKSEWPLEEPLNWNDNMDYLFGYVLSEEENHIVENTFHGDFLFQKGMFSIHKYHLSEIKDGFYEEDFNIGDPVQSVEIGQHWFYDAVVVEVRGSTVVVYSKDAADLKLGWTSPNEGKWLVSKKNILKKFKNDIQATITGKKESGESGETQFQSRTSKVASASRPVGRATTTGPCTKTIARGKIIGKLFSYGSC